MTSKLSPSAADRLAALGYEQQLDRRLNTFSNFAISLSIICILAGGVTSFSLGFSSVGGAAIGLGWPLACLFSLTVAMSMGQLASAFPTAGGLYHWAAILGGRCWGWITAWFNLLGLITVLAAINVGWFHFTTNAWIISFAADPWRGGDLQVMQGLCVLLVTVVQASINHYGLHWTTRLTNLSGYLILAITTILIFSLLLSVSDLDVSRLVRFSNYSGAKGGDVWPQHDNLAYLFCLGLLLPAYTITGFDASAHTAEETLNAEVTVPRGIVRSVLVSSLMGWLLLATMVLALPDLDAGAQQGPQLFFWLLEQRLARPLAIVLLWGISLVQFLCGLATVTSASRMLFAFARDGGVPFSRGLQFVSPRFLTPTRAVWTVALLACAFTFYTPVYSTITVVCAIFLYLSYALPLAIGFWAHGRSWRSFGPWTLGPWFKLACLVSVLGCVFLIWIGIQPPNEKAGIVLMATVAVMTMLWVTIERRRFKGPPVISI